jgi:cell fate (sporulation/competence/biofilm development) regulator YmcA (YheA/YmcA/DUF963 family)
MTIAQIEESLDAINGMLNVLITNVDAATALSEANRDSLASLVTQVPSIDQFTSLQEQVNALVEMLPADRLNISENLINQHSAQIEQLQATNVSIADLAGTNCNYSGLD